MRECSCSDDCDDFETPRIHQLVKTEYCAYAIMPLCRMKPYNIKGAAMPIYAILAQVKLNTGTGQSSCSTRTVTDGENYLARPILAMLNQLSVHGSTVTES